MRIAPDRLLPTLTAACVAIGTVLVLRALSSTAGPATVLTVRNAVAPGQAVPRADLVRAEAPAPAVPSGQGPLYATSALHPGEALVPGDLSTTAPPAFVTLGPGVVAENVSLPPAAVPAGVTAGQNVALAGSESASGGTALLATDARVLALASVIANDGEPASDVLTIALPLPSALAVADAARQGALTLLPWRVPAAEAER